jgi:hypothetical protein
LPYQLNQGGFSLGDPPEVIDRERRISAFPQVSSTLLDPATESFSIFVHEWTLCRSCLANRYP